MKRFEKHIFICENRRPDDHPRGSCAEKNSPLIKELFKKRLKELGLNAQVRANTSGCLDACEHGVTVVIYPEQVWYGKVLTDDVEDIIQQHIMGNTPVERLKIKDEKFNRT